MPALQHQQGFKVISILDWRFSLIEIVHTIDLLISLAMRGVLHNLNKP
jgi:hypothetical protein